MKITFNCPNCSVALRVEESFAGRWIRCPKCKHDLEIPTVEASRSKSAPEPGPAMAPSPTPEQLLEESDVASDVPNAPIPQDTTFVGEPGASDAETFELAENVATELKRFVPPKPSPDDPMLKKFPDFIPNPFAISYPLAQKVEGEDDVEEEAEAPVNSKMPSVDELIN